MASCDWHHAMSGIERRRQSILKTAIPLSLARLPGSEAASGARAHLLRIVESLCSGGCVRRCSRLRAVSDFAALVCDVPADPKGLGVGSATRRGLEDVDVEGSGECVEDAFIPLPARVCVTTIDEFIELGGLARFQYPGNISR